MFVDWLIIFIAFIVTFRHSFHDFSSFWSLIDSTFAEMIQALREICVFLRGEPPSALDRHRRKPTALVFAY